MTIWLLLAMSMGSSTSLTVIERFESQADCLASARQVETQFDKRALVRCVPAKVSK